MSGVHTRQPSLSACQGTVNLGYSGNIDKLQRVQRRATKFILKSDDPYDIRLKKLNILSADVTFLYKVLNDNINIDISKIIDFHSEADRFSLRSKV